MVARFAALLLLMPMAVIAGERHRVSTPAEFDAVTRTANPGDTVELADGVWRDFQILFRGRGRPDAPITLTAQTPGGVVLSGRSNLRIAGEHLVVSNLVFRDGYSPTSEVIAFRRNREERATHSRVTGVVIDRFNKPERGDADNWVALYGRDNRFDHNHLVGKTNAGATLVVVRDPEQGLENHHRIDHNFFGFRPNLGTNGGETIRVGTSHDSLSDSHTIVEYNWFEHCDGEIEIVSNKSGANTYRGNVFFESRGALVLRHGDGNRVEDNVFIGNGKPHTGGVRVINRRQLVRDNYMEGLKGEGFASALSVMYGVPNSPLNRYTQVEDVVIERNTIIDAASVLLGAGKDDERSAPPIKSRLAHTLIVNSDAHDPLRIQGDLSGLALANNVRSGRGVKDREGFATREIALERTDGGLLAAKDATVGSRRELKPIAREATGVAWYSKERKEAQLDAGRTIAVAVGDGTLIAAIANAAAGDRLQLTAGRYTVDQILTIDRPLSIEGPATIAFSRPVLFEIARGGSLKLSRLTITGGHAPDNAGNAVIRTREGAANYELVMEDVRFTDLNVNRAFDVFAAAKGTMADRVSLARVEAMNVSGDVIAADVETDDLGAYNIERLEISDSTFRDVAGAAVSLYRGGADESTFGPRLIMTGTTLERVGRSKTGGSLRLHGVQWAELRNNRSIDSGEPQLVKTVLASAPAAAPGSGGAAAPVLVTAEDWRRMAESGARYPLFAQELARVRNELESAMQGGVNAPLPRDAGGGVTHEQHKRNYKSIQQAGALYRLTGERRYLEFARALLLEYARLYPTLGAHPQGRGEIPGRLFWQTLNDSVWLVHAIQGYDAIREALSADERATIDAQVFRRMAGFLAGAPANFDRIHNHATWAVAGVGMTGYVLRDRELIDKALLGSRKDGQAGFLRQIDQLFSPDGYYEEGPYYQRYALAPFVIFARAIEQNEPSRRIFARREGVLLKAVDTVIQTSYAGLLFPLNDAIKDKGLDSEEIVAGVAVAYQQTRDARLLDIAQRQRRTLLSPDGLAVAEGLLAGKQKPYEFRSVMLRDGANGQRGGLAILRAGGGEQTLVMKNTAQGMGHGHFDKLNWVFYDNGREVITDYGAARFLNIEAKRGGTYLPENETWAKQTVAHNTLAVNGRSHFDGKLAIAESKHPTPLFFASTDGLHIAAARMNGAYEGVELKRTLALLEDAELSAPVVLDLLHATSAAPAQLDLPLHFGGHIVDVGFEVQRHLANRPVLGEASGYQHLWVDAVSPASPAARSLTWLLGGRFYTYRFVASSPTQALLVESGANDPEFNLRREPALIQRVAGATHVSFAGVLEPHGRYDGTAETVVGARSRIESIAHVRGEDSEAIILTFPSQRVVALAVANNPAPNKRHRLTVAGRSYEWTGPYARLEDAAP